MALQPFVGAWSLLQFRNLFYTDGRTPWTSDQPVARPLPTQNKRTHRHPCLWVGFEPTIPAFERAKIVHRQRGHRDRLIKLHSNKLLYKTSPWKSVKINFLSDRIYRGKRFWQRTLFHVTSHIRNFYSSVFRVDDYDASTILIQHEERSFIL
jgi:hypothetical protein